MEVSDKKRANQLDGKTWTRYSISVWSDLRKSPEELRLDHPALFPVQLAERAIECLASPKDQVILDPFAGVGSTLVAAQNLGKKGIGMEISPEYVQVTKRRLSQADLFQPGRPSAQIHRADARDLLQYVKPESVDLVLTSPPYWDILTQRRSADRQPIRHYGDSDRDLGRIQDYQEFLRAVQEVFRLVWEVMKPGKYLIVVVMDIRKRDRFYPFHSDLAKALEEIGFSYQDLIIWDRRQEYNRMRPLGYPWVFRVNKAHEYILIFRKAP